MPQYSYNAHYTALVPSVIPPVRRCLGEWGEQSAGLVRVCMMVEESGEAYLMRDGRGSEWMYPA